MNFEFSGDTRQVVNVLNSVKRKLEDLTPLLRKFAIHKRKKIQDVFDQQGPGWAPHKQSTAEVMEGRIKRRATGILKNKILKSLRRAERRYAGGLGTGKLSTLETHKEILATFRQIERGEDTESSKLDPKRVEKLKARLARGLSRATEQAGQVLGRIPSSITIEMRPDGFRIYSKIPWARVQNDGGTAGNGAQIPARPFLEWKPEDAAQFVQIGKEHFAKGLKET